MTGFDASLWLRRPWEAAPVVAGSAVSEQESEAYFYPLEQGGELIGELQLSTSPQVVQAAEAAERAWPAWDRSGFSARQQQLAQFLELLQQRREALTEVRAIEVATQPEDLRVSLTEAVEWLGTHLRALAEPLDRSLQLPGPTGESNQLRLGGRGVWLLLVDEQAELSALVQSAFLALFCGNALLLHARPGSSFSLVRFAETVREAGLDSGLVQVLPGVDEIERELLARPELAGVICLGSAERQRALALQLAARSGALVAQVVVPEAGDSPVWASQRLLLRFLSEQTLTNNLTAVGGNAELLSVAEGGANSAC